MDNPVSALHAHRIQTMLTQKGTLTLHDLPYQAGDNVEVIVLANVPAALPENPYPLRGVPVLYQEPVQPVSEQDWEAIT